MRKTLLPALLLTLLLAGCDHTPEPSPTPAPTPTLEATSTPTPTPTPSPTPEPTEEVKELWGFPVDETHDAFEVPTGGKLGTVLVTVEFEGEDSGEFRFSVWNPNDLNTPIQTMTAQEMYLRHGSSIEDVNFDGYMDFTYSATWWSHGTNARLWLWDEAAQQFVEEPAYPEIPNPRVDADTQIIEGYNYSGGWGLETYHRWENGELICFRQIEYTYPDEDFNQEKIIYERVNGELVEVSREPYAMLG